MYCLKCGQQLPDDAAFCVKCGTKVTVSLNNQEVDENSTEEISFTQQNNNQQSSTDENDNSFNKRLCHNKWLIFDEK